MAFDIWYTKLCAQVDSQVAKEIKTLDLRKLVNNTEISKLALGGGEVEGVAWLGGQSTLQRLIFGNSSQNLHKSRYQCFLIYLSMASFFLMLSKFLDFFYKYLVQNCNLDDDDVDGIAEQCDITLY